MRKTGLSVASRGLWVWVALGAACSDVAEVTELAADSEASTDSPNAPDTTVEPADIPEVDDTHAPPDVPVDEPDVRLPDVPRPTAECTIDANSALEPLWMAGGPGTRAELGKFGKPDAIFLDENGLLLAGDEDSAYEELHLYDVTSEDRAVRADWLTPIHDFGASPGPGGAGQLEFRGISGFARDRTTGHIVVAEQGNGRLQVLKPIDAAPYYAFEAFHGAFAKDKDAPLDGEFVRLQAARFDSSGRLFISDDARDNAKSARRDVQIFRADFTYLGKFGDASYGAPGEGGRLEEPENFVIDEVRDRIYVCDEGPANIAVYRYSDLAFLERFGAFIGTPNGVDIDAHGTVYVVDEGNAAEGAFIRVFEPEELTEIARFGGHGSAPGLFDSPDTLFIHAAQDLLIVADQGNDRLQGFRLSELQARACIRRLVVSGPPRLVAGGAVTTRIEVLQPGGDWERRVFRAQGTITATREGQPIDVSPGSFTVHNGMGTVSVAISSPGPVTLRFQLGGLTASREVTVLEESADEKVVSGKLTGDALRWGSDEVVRVSGVAEIAEGDTLVIEPGALVRLEAGAGLDVRGGVEANGTEEAPIQLQAMPGAHWGQWLQSGAAARLEWSNVFVTGGGDIGKPRDGVRDRHCCAPMLRVMGGTLRFDRTVVADTPFKGLFAVGVDVVIRSSAFERLGHGMELDSPNVTVEDTWVVGSYGPDDNDGIYVWGYMAKGLIEQSPQDHWEGLTREDEQIVLRRLVIADVADDGLDTRGASLRLEDSLVYGAADKAVSLTGGRPTLTRTLIASSNRGLKVDYWNVYPEWYAAHEGEEHWFGPTVTDTTIAGHTSDGLFVSDRGGGDHETADIRPTLERVVIHDVGKTVTTNWTEDEITMRQCLTQEPVGASGEGNITGSPIFLDPTGHDYRLSPLSPARALGAGWPGF